MSGSDQPRDDGPPEERWEFNYFNYFTEIEEHFQRARGAGLFLLSPLDWALIETWKNAGVPLLAVLRGIDEAFGKQRARKPTFRKVNSLAYCAQAVMEAAEAMVAADTPQADRKSAAPFSLEEVRGYLAGSLTTLRARQDNHYEPIVAALETLLAGLETLYEDLEQLEQRLTALEEKMSAIARGLQSEEALFQARRDLDAQLRQYRGKMTAGQLALIEKQYLDRRVLEDAGLPRLSLFYLQ